MKAFYLLISIFLITSCAVSKTKLSDDGKDVKVLSVPSKKCDVIGKVTGENKEGIDQLAQNHARNLAAKMDGNAIYMEMVTNGNDIKAIGTAYQCSRDE